MTTIEFFYNGNDISGFVLQGHSTENESDLEGKIVCSAVSSAAYMTVNTLTEVIGANADIEVDDGKMVVRLTSNIKSAQQVLKGFRLHLSLLADDYNNRITLLSEV